MTLVVEYPRTSYTASGVLGETWAVGFSFALDTELVVTFQTGAGAVRGQTAGVDYLVTGNRLAGGAFVTPLAGHLPLAGDMVQISRATSKDQPGAYGDSGLLKPSDVGRSLDRVTRMIQELSRDVVLGGGGGGGGGGPVYWSAILSKPVTFPPSAHTHDWAAITGKPAFGALATQNTVNDSDWSGADLSVANGGTGASTTSAARTNLGLAIGADIQAYSAITAAMAAASPSNGKIWEWTGPLAGHLINTPSGGGSGDVAPPSLAAFGTLDAGGVNTPGNDAAFTAAEASGYARIWVPEGNFATTRARSQLTKGYLGPGNIVSTTDSAGLPGRFSAITAAPTLWPVQGLAGWFRGRLGFSEASYHVIGAGTRQRTDARYYEGVFMPNDAWFDVNDGGSGCTAHLTVAASTGSSMVTVDGANSADLVGNDIIFTATFGSAQIGPVHTVTAVSGVAPAVLTLSPNPSANHPIGTFVTRSKRTWAGHTYVRVNGNAEGDVYGHIVRTNQSYQKKPGQKNVFETSTVGNYGGDMNFLAGSGGSYGTNLEFANYDQGNDVAMIGYVSSYIRDADTGAMGAMCLGTYFKSEGSKPGDAAHVVAGKWRIALDTVRADLTTYATTGDNANVAIQTAKGHRWVMNSTASSVGRGAVSGFGATFGNTLGDMFIESGNDGTSDFIAMRFNRASPNDARIRLRPDAAQINKSLSVGGSLLAVGDIVCNAGSVLGMGGSGSGAWITLFGGRIQGTINGGATYTVLV